MKKKKTVHGYTCDKCGKPATQNIQETYIIYRITKDGDFKELVSEPDGINEFYCDNCARGGEQE